MVLRFGSFLGGFVAALVTTDLLLAVRMGRLLVVNGVSVALDETAREVSERQVLPSGGPAREVRAAAADNGPTTGSIGRAGVHLEAQFGRSRHGDSQTGRGYYRQRRIAATQLRRASPLRRGFALVDRGDGAVRDCVARGLGAAEYEVKLVRERDRCFPPDASPSQRDDVVTPDDGPCRT